MEQDSIHAYEGNKIIQQEGRENPGLFVIGEEDEIVLGFLGIGLLIFKPDGHHRLIPPKVKNLYIKSSTGRIHDVISPSDPLSEEHQSNDITKNIVRLIDFHSDSVVITDHVLDYLHTPPSY